jgi:hypothetical protein
MDYQKPPEIVITHTERHDVREEMIEHVARLLCRAAGCDPDADTRCGIDPNNPSVMTCNAVGMSYPSSLGWNRYRANAESLLGKIFGEPPHGPCLSYPDADAPQLAPTTLPIDPYMSRPLPNSGATFIAPACGGEPRWCDDHCDMNGCNK